MKMDQIKILNADAREQISDWEGNNAAFTCPRCTQVFIVSALMHPEGRICPDCGLSIGTVKGSKKGGGSAILRW